MEWSDIQIHINLNDLEQVEAVAQMTVPYGIYIEDYSDLEEAVEEIAHINLIDEDLLNKDKTKAIVHIYINPDQSPIEAVSFVKERLQVLGIENEIKIAQVKEENWSTAWKTYYHPTEIGDRLVVVPSWEKYENKNNRMEIVLDPGMAFGTGTHHTTRLCLELLEKNINSGDTVLDMGTGSGILSIASLKLGAKKAVGVDIDSVAVRTARENAEENGFTEPQFTAISGDLTTDESLAEKVGSGYDVICANIVADVIIMLAETIKKHIKQGGTVLTSGIIEPRRDEVIAKLNSVGLVTEKIIECDGWCAIVFKG